MKNRIVWVPLLVIVVLFTAAFAIFRTKMVMLSSPPPQTVVVPSLVPSPAPSPFVVPTIQSKAETHGLTIEIHDVQWEGKQLRIDLCYPFPDQKHQWILTNSPEDVFVEIASQKYYVDNFGLLEWKKGAKGRKIRCDAVYFPIPQEVKEQNQATARLHILALSREIPEEVNCDEVNATLKNSGIQISCHAGGGYRVFKKPAKMSNEEVARRIAEAIAPRFQGPWIITFQLP